MIYDRLIEIFDLDTAADPLSRHLVLRSTHLGSDEPVFHKTFFEAKAAGDTVSRMVQIPLGDFAGIGDCYAVIDGDDHVYRVIEAQRAEDGDGLPVINLSLSREEAKYDLFRP